MGWQEKLWKGVYHKVHKVSAGPDEYVHYIDCGDAFMGVIAHGNSFNFTLCILPFIAYKLYPPKLKKKKTIGIRLLGDRVKKN